MAELKFNTNKMTIPEFFGKLFQTRDQIHLIHLSTKSHEVHVVLDDFYKGILELTDSLIESYQGKYGIQKIIIPSSTSTVDEITILKGLVKLTDGGEIYNRFTETFIKNQLDEISHLTYQTLYKLENLK